jgi:membrane protease YdiL (CAAX protease family)
VVLTTAIYAIVHALRPGGPHEPNPFAGIERTLALFAPLGRPEVVPSMIGLFGLGLILAAARLRTGSLWLSVGIHAAWVAVFRVGRLFLDIRRTPAWLVGPGWPPLVGGASGLVALAVTAILLLAVLSRRSRLPATDLAPTLAR